MDKSERLLNLTITLLDTERPLRAEEIRSRVVGYPDKLESFRRSFERDKDDLRDLGIPISLEPVPGTDPPAEGYRIRPEDYYLQDPGLDPDELAALHLATRSVRLGRDFDSEGLWKLGGLVDDGVGEGPLVELPPDPNLSCLLDATWTRRTVEFRYNDKERSVDPYRVELQRGWWYLIGFDHTRGEVRNFRVDRIDGSVTSGSTAAFVPPERPASGMAASGWQLPTGEEILVTIDVDADRVALFRAELGAESSTSVVQPDGSARFEVPVTNWEPFRSFLLTYLEHAVVVGPPELRTDMIQWLEGITA